MRHFVAVVERIAVRIGIQRIGSVDGRFFNVGESVRIGINAGVGRQNNLGYDLAVGGASGTGCAVLCTRIALLAVLEHAIAADRRGRRRGHVDIRIRINYDRLIDIYRRRNRYFRDGHE